MLTQSLPAASLRTGHRLPAARLLLRVSNYLIYMVLWLIGPARSDLESRFVPALREAPESFHISPWLGWTPLRSASRRCRGRRRSTGRSGGRQRWRRECRSAVRRSGRRDSTGTAGGRVAA